MRDSKSQNANGSWKVTLSAWVIAMRKKLKSKKRRKNQGAKKTDCWVFDNPAFMSRLTERYIYEVIKYGKLAVLKKEIPDSPLEAVAMPAFGDVLEDEEIRKLIELEHAILKGEPPPDSDIKAMFDEACGPCHGLGGQGNGDRAIRTQPPPKRFISEIQPPPADYTNAKFMNRFSDEFRFWLIKLGRIAASEEKGFDTMKPYGHILSDEEVWSVVRYVREVFINGNEKLR